MSRLPKLRARHLLLVAGTTLLLLGIRVAWIASGTETGWGVLIAQWRDATIGWFANDDTPVQNRIPSEQAQFWLAETERILDENPPSAELAMGAAWILDSPGMGFLHEHLRSPEPVGAPPSLRETIAQFLQPRVDYDGLRRGQEQFETRCRARCLELAERATQLEPDKAHWWRMRALLIFWCAPLTIDIQARDTNWPELLEEATRHDPDNALYDYFAALQYWNSSAVYDFSESADAYELTITDPEGFARGEEHFARAQRQTILFAGGAGLTAAADFLSRSVLPPHHQSDVAISRMVDYRGDVLLARLHRWNVVRADERRLRGDIEGAVDLWRQMLRLLEQIEAAEQYSALESKVPTYRRIGTAFPLKLAEHHAGVLSADELRDLNSARQAARLRLKAMELAAERLKLAQRGTPTPLALATAMAISLSPAPILFAGSALALVLALVITGRGAHPDLSFGPVRHALAWSAAFALTFLLSAILTVPAFSGVSAETVRRSLDLDGLSGKILLNWMTWPLAYIAVTGALLLVVAWYAARFSRSTNADLTQLLVSGPRAKWGGCLRCVGRSALGLAICILAVHLATAPPVLRAVEENHQFEMSYTRAPDVYWARFRETVADIEADADLIRQFRTELADEDESFR